MKKIIQSFQWPAAILSGLLLMAGSGLAQVPEQPASPASWSIVASYTIPGKASGLAWDGTYIYFGIYGANGNNVYKFNPADGTNSLLCSGPFSNSYGLTYKSPNLVTISQPSGSSQPASALEFSMAGTQVSTIPLPDHYMSGIAHDNGSYWVCTYYPDPGTIYHINSSGTVLSQFVPPNTQPWDICLQGSDLWIADYYGNMLYKVTTTGTLLESHASQVGKPSGIVYDGAYLWYCDGELGANSTLYKIDLLGSGTPVISVPTTSHDYGTVTVGGSVTWNCLVQNTGTANLVINSVGISPGDPISTTFAMPATITPGSSANIPLTYHPLIPGPLNTQVYINSSDPIHPTVAVTLTGNAVYSGPHVAIADTLHDWGERRMGAFSRWYLGVSNNGSQPLVISALTFSDIHFLIDGSVNLPVTIQPLQTAELGIWFHPAAGIPYAAALQIASNDPTQNPFTVSLQGQGVDTLYPIGTLLWNYMITSGFDNSPKAIVPISDVTGDGVDDVIVASEDYNIRCINGNSSGSADVMWTREIYSGNLYNQNSLTTIDDIDNDGYREVIAGTTGGDESIRAISGKTGAPVWRHDTHEYGDGGWIYQVDVQYDYNGDGFPDVLACAGDDGNDTGPRRVYCLDGKTGLSIWETPNDGPVFSVIGVADFTGDGQPDAVAGASNANETQGKVYGIDGSNGAKLWTSVTAGSSVWALIQIDDVTGDGFKDVASGDFISGNVYFHNAVTGAQTKITTIQNGALILRFQDMGDVNKDGHPDFLVGHSGANGVMINGYTGNILWQKPLADKSWNVTNMGDLNWDGVNDAAIGTLYVDNRTYFMDGPTGETMKQLAGNTPVDALSSIPDIVGDSSRELVVGGRNGGLVCLSGGYDSTLISVPGKERTGQVMAHVYPNPCRENLNVVVNLKTESGVGIAISDITGRLLYSTDMNSVPPGSHIYSINREQFAGNQYRSGVCIVTVKTVEGTGHFKIVL